MMDDLPKREIEAYGIRWIPMPNTYKLVRKFHPDEWKKISTFATTDKDLRDFLNDYKTISKIFLCHKIEDKDNHVGFIWMIYDNYLRHSVMIHGGSWQASKISTYVFYRALLSFVEHLIDCGFKVHSKCNLGNTQSLRFLRGCGFRPYAYDGNCVKLYITQREIDRSKIFQWIKRRF